MNGLMLRTGNGTPVVLGQRLGRGGEGSVYTVVNSARLAVKIYHDSQDSDDRERRLRALIEATGSGASPAVAWPRQRVMDQSGATVGFLMESFPDARPIHELYTPLSRRTYFPAANRPFLARAALNLARVVARLHDENFVIGDLNHSSVLVLPDATARLVDADSFPLPPDFICRVGTPEYMPAELQDADLRLVKRQFHHDVFAVSVLIYQLLLGGCHPFAGHGGRPSAHLRDNIRKIKRYQLTARQRADLAVSLGNGRALKVACLLESAFTRSSMKSVAARSWVAVLAGV